MGSLMNITVKPVQANTTSTMITCQTLLSCHLSFNRSIQRGVVIMFSQRQQTYAKDPDPEEQRSLSKVPFLPGEQTEVGGHEGIYCRRR